MKTVTAHLLEYAVNVVCNGNRSECARKLGVMRPDFNKLYRRCMNGGNSVTAIEGLLVMFCRDGCSIDEAMRYYVEKEGLPSLEQPSGKALACESLTRDVCKSLSKQSQEAGKKARVLRSAGLFMEQLEYLFCSDACRQKTACAEDCPCRRFAAFVEWMTERMKEKG